MIKSKEGRIGAFMEGMDKAEMEEKVKKLKWRS